MKLLGIVPELADEKFEPAQSKRMEQTHKRIIRGEATPLPKHVSMAFKSKKHNREDNVLGFEIVSGNTTLDFDKFYKPIKKVLSELSAQTRQTVKLFKVTSAGKHQITIS